MTDKRCSSLEVSSSTKSSKFSSGEYYMSPLSCRLPQAAYVDIGVSYILITRPSRLKLETSDLGTI
jgi:hypothetical protein